MTTGILSLLSTAMAQGHDKAQLQSEVTQLLGSLRDRLPRTPNVSRRLLERLANPVRLDVMDADSVVTAMAQVITSERDPLWPDLVRLNFTLARLGGNTCAFRLGQQVVAALRALPAMPDPMREQDG